MKGMPTWDKKNALNSRRSFSLSWESTCIHNDIVKPFRVRIIQYYELFQEMHNLAKHLPPPSTKVNGYEADNKKVCDK